MWFKRVLLGCYAATLAVTVVAASSAPDAALLQRRHIVEHLSTPSLERRQQPIRNQTSSSDTVQSTSSLVETSQVLTPSDIPQTSSVVQTSLVATTLESSTTIAPIPTSFSKTKDTTGTETGSSSSDVLSTASLTITDVVTPPSSATAQQPTEISTEVSLTSWRSQMSQSTISFTIVETTAIISSMSEEAQFSSIAVSSITELMPTSSSPETSSDILSSTSAILTSTLDVSTVQPPPSSTGTSADDSASSSTAIETKPSSTPAPSTQIETAISSSTTIDTPVEPSVTLAPSTAPVEQQSSAVFSSLSSLIDTASSSTSSQALTTTSSAAASSTSPQEPITISTPETLISTSAPALSSSLEVSQASSSPETNLPTSEVQSTSVAVTSTSEVQSNVQTSTIASDATMSQVETSSVAEIPNLTSSTTDLETASTPFVSVTALPSPSSIESSFSSSLPDSIPVVSTDQSSVTPSTTLTSQVDAVTSSTQTVDPQSSIQPTSGPIREPSSTLSDAIDTSSLVLTSDSAPSPTGTATETETSISATPSTTISPSSTMQPFSSAENDPTSSPAGVISSETISMLSSSSTFVPTALSTSLEATVSMATSEVPVVTSSLGTSAISSTLPTSEVASSLAPSETLTSSADIPATSSSFTGESASISSGLSSKITVVPGTQSSFPEQPWTSSPIFQQSTMSISTSSKDSAILSQASSVFESVPSSTLPSLTIRSTLLSSSRVSGGQTFLSQNPTSVVASSMNSTADGSMPTSEASSSRSIQPSLGSSPTLVSTHPAMSSSASSRAFTTTSKVASLPLSSAVSNGTRTQTSRPFTSGIVTATFSTVYVSSIRSKTLDLSTVPFSFFSSVTEAAINHTHVRTSATLASHVPASETLTQSSKIGIGANSTWSSPLQPSMTTATGFFNSTTRSAELGMTFSRSVLPTGSSVSNGPILNGTRAETLETSSMHSAPESTSAGLNASTTSDSVSSIPTDVQSETSKTTSDESSTTDGAGIDVTLTDVPSNLPTPTPSETKTAEKPPPLTTSQTAGVAVGATTGLLIAVVAAIFLARRYHAAKQGKRRSTGSIYPKVAYLYDPKTGGDGGAAEALMSGGTSGLPPSGSAARAVHGSPKHLQRHSTGAMPTTRFTSPGNPFKDSIRAPTHQRYSEYARLDTARALSAAVAGYGAAPRHPSSYTRHPSDVTNPFSDHVIPSPTFAPFSPDDIRRPELPSAAGANDGRDGYAQMPASTYSYLNTAASMYPPISPYEGPSGQGPSPLHHSRRHTVDSNPFADPFEHDLILQVDERNRTSDSVTVFAGSPNLIPPRTPRTPVGPKLPVRQPNGMTSSRSLLSPVAAKYMHKAQEVKIPRKSIASPVLVQVGRSPVIKPFSPPPAAPEYRGWDDIKRQSENEQRFSDEQSVPAPLNFKAPVVTRKPVPGTHTAMKPSLTGAGQALLAGNGLPLTVNIPHMYKKSVGLDVPRVLARPDPTNEDVSSDPVVREKRSRELRFADPALIGKEF